MGRKTGATTTGSVLSLLTFRLWSRGITGITWAARRPECFSIFDAGSSRAATRTSDEPNFSGEHVMAAGWAQKVVSKVELSGVIAEIVNNSYEAGGSTSVCNSDIVIRWRSSPHGRISAWARGDSPTLAGQMMLLPPGVPTGAKACDGPVETNSLVLHLDPEWLQDTIGVTAKRLCGVSRAMFQFKDASIEHAMRRMYTELLSPKPLTATIIQSCSTLVAADLISRFTTDSPSRAQLSLSELRVQQINEFVQGYEAGWPRQQEIANSLGIGAGHMREIYRKVTGRTLFAYMEEVRIARAQAMLAQGGIPLKVIAHRLGFSSPSAFSSAFRLEMGMAPGAYRAIVLNYALSAPSDS